jgi:hypothetical protein
MNKKNLVVTLCMFVFALFLVASASAADLTSNYQVTVNGIATSQAVGGNTTLAPNTVSVTAGGQMTVKVYFTSDVNDTNVDVEATVEGQKVSFSGSTPIFDVEQGHQYVEVLTMNVPYELQNSLSNDLTLSIKVNGENYRTTLNDISLRVQRPAYNIQVESVTTPSSIEAGQQIPVEIVLKNIGYNELSDVYVSAAISDLGVAQGPKWFGDLVTLDNCTENCNNKDTVVGDLYLTVPYDAKSGVYNLQVLVQNNDVKTVQTKQIVITNTVPNTVLATSTKQTVNAGETATYSVLIVNPTNNVKVYNIVADSGVTPSQSVVAVPAGSSATVTVSGSSTEAGQHVYNVNVFDGTTLVKTVPLEMDVTGGASSNTIVVLTIVLAIIFLVLLVVLIVLLSKKPEKATEDFGESYY